MWVDALRWLHVIGATVLMGTGAGIAFFMLMAHRSGDARVIAHVAGTVVIADFVFTASAVVLQPITGALLAEAIGWPLTSGWLALSILLYILTGLFWLPVVAIQMKLRRLAEAAAASGAELPVLYHRLFAIWVFCGFPAFTAVAAILWLMTSRPDLAFTLPGF
jgi:uncharacterized membrane protein